MDDVTRQRLASGLRDGREDETLTLLSGLLREGENTAEVHGWMADTLLRTNPQGAYEHAVAGIAAAHRQYGQEIAGNTTVGMALTYDDLLLVAAKAAYALENDAEVLRLLNEVSAERARSSDVLLIRVASTNRSAGVPKRWTECFDSSTRRWAMARPANTSLLFRESARSTRCGLRSPKTWSAPQTTK